MLKEVFRYQIYHLMAVIILLTSIYALTINNYDLMKGALWGVTTRVWFWAAIVTPIFHQVYVWLIWRFELHYNVFTSRFGVARGFKIYAVGFAILFVSRLIFIFFLALSNQGSLVINPVFIYLPAAIITPIVIYLFYSVKKYFTIERAFGIDHFDKTYNKPYVKEGIFRFTDNGMYVYGLMILYLPGLLLFSKAALIVAVFNHMYIWVHYYCTERPDMKIIYEEMPGE